MFGHLRMSPKFPLLPPPEGKETINQSKNVGFIK